MATNKSTSRNRSPRNHAKATAPGASANSDSSEPRVAAATLEDAIEAERARLMTAEAVLHCVVIAMDESDADTTQDPHYQGVLRLARDLVVQTIDQLDSLRVAPMLSKVGSHGMHEVEERSIEYVH
jgi:hypothetical protein